MQFQTSLYAISVAMVDIRPGRTCVTAHDYWSCTQEAPHSMQSDPLKICRMGQSMLYEYDI